MKVVKGPVSRTMRVLTQDILCSSCTNDDLCFQGSDTDINTGVAVFCKLSSKQLVELCVENTVRYKLQTSIGIVRRLSSRFSRYAKACLDKDCSC